jgi:hypothetical protein
VVLGVGLAVIPGTTFTITLERAGTISVQGNVNVITQQEAFVYIYLNGEQIGPPGYTSMPNVWTNIPVFAMRNVPAGTYTISLRGLASPNGRAGSRVVTATAF